MKNINTDVILFSGINSTGNSDELNLYNVNKEFPIISANKLDGETLSIMEISFMLSINANEKIDENGSAVRDEGDTAENTFFFDEKYEICLRITETNSGKFIDLDTFDIKASEKNIKLCRNIYAKKFTCQYQNVRVATPPDGNDFCVLKVLIRHLSENTLVKPQKWIVQSMHPIHLNIC